MKLIETYAANSGLQISKPFIYEKYFPLLIEKFITIHKEVKYPSRQYLYWQEVVDILEPILSKQNIQIAQIGTNEDKPLNGVFSLLGNTTFNQLAFVMKNSLLHVGVDSFPVHLASFYDKNIVSIYSNTNSNNMGPYWGDKKKHILIEADRKGNKPTYSFDEHPKTINTIKPEAISKAVLNLLNIKNEKLPKSIYFGENYQNKTLEIIPDQPIDPNQIPIPNIIVRMDYHFNEEILAFWLQHKQCIILTNKPINIDLLNNFKNNILQVIYIIEKDNDFKFVKSLKNKGIQFGMISYMEAEELNEYKIDYMDYGLIIERKKQTKNSVDIKNINNLYYKSSKILLSGKGQFISKYQWTNQIDNNKVVDDSSFWEDLDTYYLFKLD